MWLTMLVLIAVGIMVSLLAGLLGGMLQKSEIECWPEALTLPVMREEDLQTPEDASWAHRPWPYIRDRLTFPPLDIPSVEVSSTVSDDKHYLVNPARLTCTCSYFLLRGAQAPLGSKERLCRHLRQVYARHGQMATVVNMVLLDDVHFCETDQLWSGEVEGIPVAIAWREGDPWVTIYTRNNALSQAAEFQRYGFHIDHAVWLDGHVPKYNAVAIRTMLADWFTHNRPGSGDKALIP